MSDLQIKSVGYDGGPVIYVAEGYEFEKAVRLTNAEAFDLLRQLAAAIKFPESGA
jgi:hypothetical protein